MPVDIDVEDLGVKLPPLCIKCKGCTDCSSQRLEMTREEREVYELVKKGMKIVGEKSNSLIKTI